MLRGTGRWPLQPWLVVVGLGLVGSVGSWRWLWLGRLPGLSAVVVSGLLLVGGGQAGAEHWLGKRRAEVGVFHLLCRTFSTAAAAAASVW